MRVFAPLVWLAIIQVFVLSLLASSLELHERFHSGSNNSDHHCLCTDLKSGTLDQPLAVPTQAPAFVALAIWAEPVPALVRRSLPLHLCGSLLEHGPPVIA